MTEAYDNCNNLVTKTDRLGVVTTNAYDALNRLISVTAKKNGSSVAENMAYVYYKTGAKKQETNESVSSVFTYDDAGRVIQQIDTNNTASAVNGFTLPSLTVSKYQSYDVRDNRKTLNVYTNGNVTLSESYDYDSMNRMTKEYDSGAVQATYTYDLNGNRQSLIYPNGVTTSYTYNSANLVTNMSNMRGSTVLSSYMYTYMLDGNQLTKQDDTMIATTYVYDDLGRLTSESETMPPLARGAVSTTYNTKTYAYDTSNNRISMTVSTTVGGATAGCATAYTYNADNQLIAERQTPTSGAVVTTTYTVDANGNQTSKSVNGITQTFTYDVFNRLAQTNTGTAVLSYRYKADGLRIGVYNKPNTGTPQTTLQVWDGANIVCELDGAVKLANRYIRGVNLIKTAQGAIPDWAASMINLRVVYQKYYAITNSNTYTAVSWQNFQDALTNAKNEMADVAGSTQLSVDRALAAMDSGYAALLPVAPTDYAAASPSSRTMLNSLYTSFSATANNNAYTAGSWANFQNALTKAKTVINQAAPTQSAVDAASAGLKAAYNVLMPIANQWYFLFNAHGDVTQQTNTSGVVIRNYYYDSFGVEINPVSSDTNPWRYAGEYYDLGTNMYYLRARYYNPTTGRFLSEDPIRNGLNYYTYCSNNPIAFLDIFGLKEVPLRATIREYYGFDDKSDALQWDKATKTASIYGVSFGTSSNCTYYAYVNSKGVMMVDDVQFGRNPLPEKPLQTGLKAIGQDILDNTPIGNWGQAIAGRDLYEPLTPEQRTAKAQNGVNQLADNFEAGAFMGDVGIEGSMPGVPVGLGRGLIGTKTANGTIITRVSDHALDRVNERGFTSERISNTLIKPESTYPGNTPNTTCYQGSGCRIVVSNDGTIVTVIVLGSGK